MITQDPGICFGQPVFTGTRIPVAVVAARLQSGHSRQELATDYPRLAPAAFDYAAKLKTLVATTEAV